MASVTSFSSTAGPPPRGPCIPESCPPCPASTTITCVPRGRAGARVASDGGGAARDGATVGAAATGFDCAPGATGRGAVATGANTRSSRRSAS